MSAPGRRKLFVAVGDALDARGQRRLERVEHFGVEIGIEAHGAHIVGRLRFRRRGPVDGLDGVRLELVSSQILFTGADLEQIFIGGKVQPGVQTRIRGVVRGGEGDQPAHGGVVHRDLDFGFRGGFCPGACVTAGAENREDRAEEGGRGPLPGMHHDCLSLGADSSSSLSSSGDIERDRREILHGEGVGAAGGGDAKRHGDRRGHPPLFLFGCEAEPPARPFRQNFLTEHRHRQPDRPAAAA